MASACPPGTHYVDVANELSAVQTVLGLGRRAAAAGQVMVTGAGFGVLGTEGVVLRLCDGQPRPTQVRVDAIPSLALEAGVVGEALAATIVEIIRFGGRSVKGGRLVASPSVADPLTLTTPDGDVISTGSGANGELVAAWRASGADGVVAATTAAPSNGLVRLLLPAVTGVVRLPGMGQLATRGIARVPLRAAARPRPSSWGHARVQWPSGLVRDGWLRVGDAMEFTASVAAEATRRLLRGEGRPGSYTPGVAGPQRTVHVDEGVGEGVVRRRSEAVERVLRGEGAGGDGVEQRLSLRPVHRTTVGGRRVASGRSPGLRLHRPFTVKPAVHLR